MKTLIATLLLAVTSLAPDIEADEAARDAANAAASAVAEKGSENSPHPVPRRGLICLAAIHHAMAEVGKRCLPGKNPAFQANLEAMIPRIDRRILQDPRFTPDILDRLMRQQNGSELTDAQFCGSDALELYTQMMARSGEMHNEIEWTLARPGPAEWGACL